MARGVNADQFWAVLALLAAIFYYLYTQKLLIITGTVGLNAETFIGAIFLYLIYDNYK